MLYCLPLLFLMMPAPRYSIVVPVYKNEESLPYLIAEILDLSLGDALEIVFVIDGSPDNSYRVLRDALLVRNVRSQLVQLSRNFGSFSAIRAGMSIARGEYVAVMAADLQEPPGVVRTFFEELDAGTCDIVLGRRVSRDDPSGSRMASHLYWRAYRLLVLPEIPEGGIDIFACTRKVCQVIVSMEETNTSLVGLLFWIGFSRKLVPYHRRPRQHGRSAWTFGRKWRYMTDSVFAFSDLPIRIMTAVGMLGVVTSLVVSLAVFAAWLTGRIEIRGYTPLILAIFFIGMLLLTSVGVVGAYVFRTYENSKGRPPFIIASHENFGSEP
jgi:glycosyltransferase involved in cell wall biosynthesis